MTKKSYRDQQSAASGPPGPRYPTLNELRLGSLRQWGLAAMGTMLLGAGCWRSTNAAEQGDHETRAHAKGKPDSGAPPPPPQIQHHEGAGEETPTGAGHGEGACAEAEGPRPVGRGGLRRHLP